MKCKLTPAQFKALEKWEKGPAHHSALGVRWDVYHRLIGRRLLKSAGFTLVQISDAGRAVLAECRAKALGEERKDD